MNVLTIYAHQNPHSFCHAILDRFTDGLRDGGHASEVVDLHAIRFDPVLRDRDVPSWIDDSVPDDVLEHMNIRVALTRQARSRWRSWMVRRWMGDRSPREIVRRVRALGSPRDVAEQQAKVAWADGLAFIAPVFFVGFPAILKGWIERVFTLGFAFGLSPEGWRGDIGGRIPLLRHEKALIMQPTIFDEAAYEAGLKEHMAALIDDYGLRYPGIRGVERVYFYAVHGADDATRKGYLDRAYELGRDF
jgi:NAD(P)H dehydrogenase (quinone)